MDRPWKMEQSGDGLTRIRFQAMASPCELIVAGAADDALLHHLAATAVSEAARIEKKWSRYRTDNLVHQINHAQGLPVEVDEETARLIDFGAWLHERSEGRFDLTSGVLRRLWRFDGSNRLPEPDAVAALMRSVGWSRVHWQNSVLQMPAGMEIDFGGIGKEYAVDRCLGLLRQIADLPLLLNFGGDLAANRPRPDGQAWQVGIEAAHAPGIRLQAGGVATSGDSYRFLLHAGRRYSHILDARSGWPVEDAARTVTVAASTCTEAGVHTTLAMLQGPGAEDYLRREGVDYHVSR